MAVLVRQLIEQVYCCKYVGQLKLRDLRNWDQTHRGWMVSLMFHGYERPLEIAYDGTDVEFLQHLHERLHMDHLHDVDYYNGYKIRLDPNQDPSTAIPPKYPSASLM